MEGKKALGYPKSCRLRVLNRVQTQDGDTSDWVEYSAETVLEALERTWKRIDSIRTLTGNKAVSLAKNQERLLGLLKEALRGIQEIISVLKGADIGYWKRDVDDFKKDMSNLALYVADTGDGFSGKIEHRVLNPELKVFYEHPLNNNWHIGGSIGLGSPATAKYSCDYTVTLTPDSWSIKLEGNGRNVPIFLYAAKRMEKLAWSGGVGFNYHSMQTELSHRESSGSGVETFEKTKSILSGRRGWGVFHQGEFLARVELEVPLL